MEILIREMKEEDVARCADILMEVYNNDLWQCRWEKETARSYLMDYFGAARFIGYVLETEGGIRGAIFCHEKIWWNNNEVFIDEMFISPAYQRQGLGSMLLRKVEEYIAEHRLAGFTLTTNRYAPAPAFYRSNGFTDCDHFLFMAKEM